MSPRLMSPRRKLPNVLDVKQDAKAVHTLTITLGRFTNHAVSQVKKTVFGVEVAAAPKITVGQTAALPRNDGMMPNALWPITMITINHF